MSVKKSPAKAPEDRLAWVAKAKAIIKTGEPKLAAAEANLANVLAAYWGKLQEVLKEARTNFSHRMIATHLGKSHRWVNAVMRWNPAGSTTPFSDTVNPNKKAKKAKPLTRSQEEHLKEHAEGDGNPRKGGMPDEYVERLLGENPKQRVGYMLNRLRSTCGFLETLKKTKLDGVEERQLAVLRLRLQETASLCREADEACAAALPTTEGAPLVPAEKPENVSLGLLPRQRAKAQQKPAAPAERVAATA